jgi:hypothetical protein
MVTQGSSLSWNVNYTPAGTGVVVYVMRGSGPSWTASGCCDFTMQSQNLHGIVVVEGNGQSGCGGSRDIWHKNGAKIRTQPPLYGYPLAYLLFDPVDAVTLAPQPTANPLNPQGVCADMGSASGTEIHGLVYSGGHVEFNPVVVDGGVVAFEIQTQSTSSAYAYNPTFGNAAPPPGFPEGSGNTVVLVRKSFIVCVDYAADTGGGSACR